MSLTENFGGAGGLSAADVAAVIGSNRGGGNGNGNNGWGGDSGWWILLLFLFAFNRGFGNGGGGFGCGGSGGGGNMTDTINLYGGMGNGLQRGFDQQATISGINGIQQSLNSGFMDAALARCQGDANIVQAITGAQNNISQGVNSLAMALQQCCCDNRAGLADLKYTVATENCQDRQVVSDGFRDLQMSNFQNTQTILNGINSQIQATQQGTQTIVDKLCQLELDGYKQRISDLQADNLALRNDRSQTAQTATIIQNNDAQTAQLLARLNPPAVPAYIVQNPSCCNQQFYNNGYGCGN